MLSLIISHLPESADDLPSYYLNTSVGGAESFAAGAGVYHTDVTVVRTVNGNVFRLMCVPEEKYVSLKGYSVVRRSLISGLHIKPVPVHYEKFLSANLDGTFVYLSLHFGRCGHAKVAVAEYVVRGNLGKLLHGREKIPYPVSEEEYMVNSARVFVYTDVVGNIFWVAV